MFAREFILQTGAATRLVLWMGMHDACVRLRCANRTYVATCLRRDTFTLRLARAPILPIGAGMRPVLWLGIRESDYAALIGPTSLRVYVGTLSRFG